MINTQRLKISWINRQIDTLGLWVEKKLEKKPLVAERMFYSFGTVVHLLAYGRQAENALNEASEVLYRMDDRLSAFKAGSEVSEINRAAGMHAVKVSSDTYQLIQSAMKYAEMMEGAFDPTIRPLVCLWGIGSAEEQIPHPLRIAETMRKVSYKDIIMNDREQSVKLARPGQALDLGGIAKGYAADVIHQIFQKHRVRNGMIDLGGNVKAIGSRDDHDWWRIGLQNPENDRGDFLGILKAKNKSVVTSGTYEKFFEVNGRRFHHIIDPRTGYPSESRIISATVVSEDSIDGDGMTTGLLILGVSKAIECIEKTKNVSAILLTTDRKIYISKELENMFQLTDTQYEIKYF